MPERADVLLVGGGVASARCARQLRKDGFDGRIVLVGDEPMPPYNRPPLSKELMRADLPDDLVLAEPERWYERRRIDLLIDFRAEALDLDTRTAELDDGSTVRFERCLIATGAEPRLLPVPGAEHALVLRTLADSRAIRRAALDAGRDAPVVVVGGGFIGLEVASSLATLSLRPTVVELGQRLWSGSMGTELSRWAVWELARAGIEVRLGSGVTRVEPDAAWIGDERLEAAFVVAGIGVRPREAVASDAGLAVSDGVVTDAAHRTSHPAVWAAGDVARRAGVRIEHWHAAREGGERAARSMLGLDIRPEPAPWVFSDVAGHQIDVIGAPDGWNREEWIVPDRLLAFLEADRVVQVASIDAAAPVEELRQLVAERPSLDELRTVSNRRGRIEAT